MKADIIAFKGNTFVSKIIRLVTKKDITHIAIMVGESVLMETAFFGVRLRRLKENESEYYLLRHEGLSNEQKKDIACFVMHKVKTKYDFKLFFGIGFNKLFNINTKWNNTNRYICLELILEAYKSVGIDLLPDHCSNNMIPNDILDSTLLTKI